MSNRAQNRRTTPSKKGQAKTERNAMLRLLILAVDAAGGELVFSPQAQREMPANTELRHTTDPDGSVRLSITKPEPLPPVRLKDKVAVIGGAPLPPGLRELLTGLDPRTPPDPSTYHQTPTTDQLQELAEGEGPMAESLRAAQARGAAQVERMEANTAALPEAMGKVGLIRGKAHPERWEDEHIDVMAAIREGARQAASAPNAAELEAFHRAQQATGPGKSA